MNDQAAAFAEYNWLTVAEVAKALRCSHAFVRARIGAEVGGFQFRNVLKKGRDYLIPPSEVSRYIETQTVNSAA